MNTVLRTVLFVFLALFFMLTIRLIQKKRLGLKYSLLWIFSSVFIAVMLLMPDLLTYASNAIGIKDPVNFAFLLLGGFALVIILSLSVVVSELSDGIKRLTQAYALLELRLRDEEKRTNK